MYIISSYVGDSEREKRLLIRSLASLISLFEYFELNSSHCDANDFGVEDNVLKIEEKIS